MSSHTVCGIALVGCGTVGGGTAVLLARDRENLAQRTGADINLKYIIDRDHAHARRLGLPEALFETRLETALADPEVQIVIELVGGTTIARDVIRRSLEAGKHVVTANKALLAHHGADLMAVAQAHNVALAFEASCAGGVPVIRALYDGLIANRIDAIYGIVNGTCNYILTEMIQKGQGYAEALKEAQRAGLAEADPYLDVSGTDSAHKLAIMAALAFGQRIEFEKIPVSGIDTLELIDVTFGQELGYTVKLLAIAQRTERGVSLRVRPSFITREHPLAWVSGPFNAVSIYGHAVGHTMYYGRGAGATPTASAVIADIVSIAIGNAVRSFQSLQIWPDRTIQALQLPSAQIESRYYLRITVDDRPGVFGQLATILGSHSISISSVLQKEPKEGEPGEVPVVITTHRALEGAILSALAEIDALPVVKRSSVCIGIIDEHEENLPGVAG
ncbi:MAG TPA: homoserine dehydrogenase [Spirochaetia bacterium]|nr:homoserine dehydrogenase [Spirochaetia bacterium]